MSKRIPVIIDTDIGDDIDDAFALCLAMQSPEIEILGVTTVFKNSRARAMIAKRLLELGGHPDIPVAAGASIPLSNPEMFGKPVDFEELPKSYRPEYETGLYSVLTGMELIISILENSSEPVTVVTLGALTNIADVLRYRPDLKKKIRQINVMGGAYYMNWTEYNYACDPEAADMVMCSGLTVKAVGIDVTLHCVPEKKWMLALNSHTHPCIQMLMEMCRMWTKDGNVCLHDPLALWSVFDESVLEFEQQIYRVESRARFTRGICIKLSDHNWQIPGRDSRLYVAKQVDAPAFVARCMDRIVSMGEMK